MLLHTYQVFSSLVGDLHFFVHFFFNLMEYFFFGHPISTENIYFFEELTGSKDISLSRRRRNRGGKIGNEKRHQQQKTNLQLHGCTVVQNNLIWGHQIIYFPASLEVSQWASERMSAVENASEASSREQANE